MLSLSGAAAAVPQIRNGIVGVRFALGESGGEEEDDDGVVTVVA